MHSESLLAIKVEAEAWATPRPGLSLAGLCAVLNNMGNQVLEVDAPRNRVRVLWTEDKV